MKTLIIALLVLIGFVSASAQKVKVTANPNVDVSKYRTYMWTKGLPMSNPLIHQIIVEAVDRAMAEKGLKKVETDGELTIVAWAATESDMHISHPSWYPAMNPISTGIVVSSSSWPITKGTLVIDLKETATKDEVWRGTATDTLEHGPSGSAAKDAKSVEKKINKAVTKMFKKYPRG